MCFDGCTALCQRLRANDPTLTVLNLNHLYMGNDGAKALAKALQCNTTVVVLFLQHNNLGAAGIQALATALQYHPRLAHLYLDDNCIGDAGCHALAQLLQGAVSSKHLQVLKIADNGIGPVGARILAAALPHANLEYLSLQKNVLGCAGMQALWQALSHPSTTLRWLDVRCNKIAPTAYLQVTQGWTRVLQQAKNETLCVLELWERDERDAVPTDAATELHFWLQWNRAGRRSLKHHQDNIPVKRLLSNAAAASPTVIWATLQARPDLVTSSK